LAAKIWTIPLGIDQCYVIQDEGTILIDGGELKKGRVFKNALEKLSIDPKEIQLIVLTHGHFDHVGSVRDIKRITGAKIAIHQLDKFYLEMGLVVIPPGVTLWGKISRFLFLKPFVSFFRFPGVKADVILGNEDLSLADYGIQGEVIYTPGHTPGSVSVLLKTGEAFVGDLAMNKFPMRITPGLPIFAEDKSKVKKSLELLLQKGARIIYPAHGKPFNVEIIRKILS
jgi:glyoxylase-like metal-dependent hydrolase (beta-lactamase superfamily II)